MACPTPRRRPDEPDTARRNGGPDRDSRISQKPLSGPPELQAGAQILDGARILAGL
ncbi:hypothetical protein J7L01_08090 [bacterium]|nr:hypothetical protein [bacterium]